MTVALPSASSVPVDVVGVPFSLSVEKYHEMVATGILTPDDRVELLEGVLISKMGHNPPHRTAVIKLTQAFAKLNLGERFPQHQLPITLNRSEPEPDGAIIDGTVDDFSQHNPSPPAVLLVAEISDATLQQDRVTKLAIYAAAGIGIYWIINLIDRQIEVYEQPDATTSSYLQKNIFRAGDSVKVVVAGQSLGRVAVNDLLP